jgi:starch synthase
MEKSKILYVTQEINPFLIKSELSEIVRTLSQGVHEQDKEIRIFMPRFGVINERRHQLHEVIRLSGMNMIVNDYDHPLIIIIASIPQIRIQVYFIDNEEYFKRKQVFTDEAGKPFKDNDERSMFFCRGVLETVKKLGWAPDVVHCGGWMTALVPLYLKKAFADDPIFSNTKIVYSVFDL